MNLSQNKKIYGALVINTIHPHANIHQKMALQKAIGTTAQALGEVIREGDDGYKGLGHGC